MPDCSEAAIDPFFLGDNEFQPAGHPDWQHLLPEEDSYAQAAAGRAARFRPKAGNERVDL